MKSLSDKNESEQHDHEHENSNENIYVDNVKLNEKYYNKNWLHHDDLKKGGKLIFNMKNTPNVDWGSSKSSIPYSMSNE